MVANDLQEQILNVLQRNRRLFLVEIADELGGRSMERPVARELKALLRNGLVSEWVGEYYI